MAAPVLTPLPAPPTRANPADFAARADSFMGALPGFVTQLNALVAYWNTNLDTTAFINRNVASTMLQTLTFAMPPVMQASATSGDQVALTLSKGTTQRQSIRIGNDGSINIVPLNGATAALKVNGQTVYHPGNKPTATELGLVTAGNFTDANILTMLKNVDGAGSGLDADLLDGQQGSYYLNAANMTGTFADARAPSTIVRTSRNITSGDGLSGGGNLSADRTLAVDSTVARRNAGNTFTGSQYILGHLFVDAPTATGNSEFWLRANDGLRRAVLFSGADANTHLRSYATDGVNYKTFSFNGSTGRLSAASFGGDGSALTNLNPANMGTGVFDVDRIPSSIARTSVTISAGDGLNGGGSLAGSRTLSVDSTVVRTSRQVLAGMGLAGGGNLGGDRTISLGIPSSITADSENTRTDTSHTHSLSAAAVGELTSRLGVGAIGTYALLTPGGTGAWQVGRTVSGSSLYYANASGRIDHPGQFNAQSPSGTWQLHGILSSYTSGDGRMVSLFKRIS